MMSVLLEFAMFPTDKGESVSQYVGEVIQMIKESGVRYKLTAMGTIIETETIDEALAIVSKSYKVLEPYSNRVYSSVKLDIRKGKSNRLEEKIKSIESKIGKVDH
ncbi:MAG: MTH1187 family thiamine-binding protein [Bacteroidales bacterium]